MFPLQLLATLLLIVAVAAKPIIPIRKAAVNIPLIRKINLNGGSLYEHDLTRAASIGSRGSTEHAKRQNTPAQNRAVSYIANISVGNPATVYSLIIDTGSSNTWVGAKLPYNATETSYDTGNAVEVHYGSGSFKGEEYLDQVDFGDGLVINNQSIGVASTSKGIPFDGILGLGPVGLTVGTVNNTKEVPTVTENLFTQGTIKAELIGISFEPKVNNPDDNGELSWGGVDDSKYTGSITYVPITTTSPAGNYWGIDQSITYGKDTNILSTTAGIVDTGTTLVLLATDAYKAYKDATGATEDAKVHLLTLSSSGYANLQSLFFTIGETVFEFTPNAQIWPRSLNTVIGGDPGSIYVIIGDLKKSSGSGLDFINGQSWLERFYSVYDTTQGLVGIANTNYTYATSN